MVVPYIDMTAAHRELALELNSAVTRVLESGWYVLGPEVEAFESAYASYCGSAHCVGVSNGLDALRLGLMALGVGPGDEVIVPSNTYVATWLAVSQCGAVPVPVEPDVNTFNIDPTLIAPAITSRTKVILPVHLYGRPADMSAILAIARDHGLRVMEDAAQAHGAWTAGKRIGAHGDLVAWSFYPTKNLGAAGDAGAVTTDDFELAERLRLLRNYGAKQRYRAEMKGYNCRLDPIQAAVLSVKLKYIDEWNERRVNVANTYLDELDGSGRLVLPSHGQNEKSVWHIFAVRHPDRDRLKKRLSEAGIDTIVHYPIPPHLQTAYRELGFAAGDFPIAEGIAGEILSLPIGPHLSREGILRVVAALKNHA